MKFIHGLLAFLRRGFLLLCFFVVTAYLQTGPLHALDSLQFHQRYSFSPYPDSRADVVNHFLLKIAEGNGKLRAYTSYTIDGVISYRLSQARESGCRISLQMTPLEFHGDISYKNFGLEKLLTPDLLAFQLTAWSSDGKEVYKQSFQDVEIAENGNADIPTLSDWCTDAVYKWEISGLNFYYSEGLFDRFDSWLDALESYYKAGEEIRHIVPMLQGLGFDDPERLIMDEFNLCEVEQRLADIKYASFHQWIDLSRGDPEQLLGEYDKLAAMADSLREGFNRSISRIDTLFYEKAMLHQEEAEVDTARYLLEQALVYNPFHIPSNLALASYDLRDGDKNKALLRLEDVVAVMYPYDYWQQQTKILSDSVLHEYFLESSELIEDGRFLDALGVLGDVERFCIRTEGRFDCPELLFYHQSLAHQGMFRSFMVVSERAFNNGNLSFCVTYLRSALQYQDENREYVPDPKWATTLMRDVYNQYREQGEDLYANGDLLRASEFFMQANKLCQEFSFLHCP